MGDIHQPESVRISDRISFLVLDRGTLHASAHALEWVRESGVVDIPADMATALFLEPGVSVTHAAVKLCADHGTLLAWIGEAGVHLYAASMTSSAAGERRLRGQRTPARCRFPAYAGMKGTTFAAHAGRQGFPRIRGDERLPAMDCGTAPALPPHTRG